MPAKTDYTREQLIKICKKSVVDKSLWRDRDTPSAQTGVGLAWIMLKAGCDFEVQVPTGYQDELCVTDENTIWVEIYHPNFSDMENGFEYGENGRIRVYLPTKKRLKRSKGKDWY